MLTSIQCSSQDNAKPSASDARLSQDGASRARRSPGFLRAADNLRRSTIHSKADHCREGRALEESNVPIPSLSIFTAVRQFKPKSCTTVFEDNQQTIVWAQDPKHHGRNKHLDVKLHFIKEKVQAGVVDLKYVSTEEQLADLMTKPLGRVTFERLVDMIMWTPRSRTD